MLSDTWEGMLSDTGRAGALFHVRQSDWALAGHTQKGGALSSLHELAMRGNSVLRGGSLRPSKAPDHGTLMMFGQMRNYGICLRVAFRCGLSGNGIACAGSLSLQKPTIPRRSAAIHHCLAGADFVFRSDHRESQPSTIARKFCSTASKPPV